MSSVMQHVEQEYRQRTPKSAALHAQAIKVMPGGETRSSTYFAPYPVVIAEAAGPYVQDVDGHRMLDFMNNATTLIHGHAFPPVVEAARHQVETGTAWGALNEHQIALAALLCARVASLDQVRFTNSGTEATMMAIRAARAFTGRDIVIKVEGGYHGTHDAVSVSISPPLALAGSGSVPNSVPASPGVPAESLASTCIVPFNDTAALEQRVQEHAGNIAAVIVEPLLASHGMVTATPDYLQAVRQITAAHDILLILDEVQTFRLDSGGAQALYAVQPDLTSFAKIIGGGFPVGAFGGRADIMQQYSPASAHTIDHGGTFNGNPVTMAAGFAAMHHLTPEKIAYINGLGDRLHTGLQEVLAEQGVQGQIEGKGSLLGIHLTPEAIGNYRHTRSFPAPLKHTLFLACLNRGLLMSTGCNLNTSTVMTEAEIDQAIRIFQEALIEMYPLIEEKFPQLLLA